MLYTKHMYTCMYRCSLAALVVMCSEKKESGLSTGGLQCDICFGEKPKDFILIEVKIDVHDVIVS